MPNITDLLLDALQAALTAAAFVLAMAALFP
jgi:hypothetical protein